MKSFLTAISFGRPRIFWALLPLLAFLFTCEAGRGWPFRVGPGFPRGVDRGTTATLTVYSPDVRTLLLEAKFQVDAPASPPALFISIIHDDGAQTSSAATRPTGADGLIEAAAPLRLQPGVSTIKLTLGPAASGPMAFSVAFLRVTQDLFTAGNLWFGLTLAAIVAGSILAGQALGANGLNLFCAASLVGFLLVTSSATILSPFHLLTSRGWAVALMVSSLLLGAAAALRLRRHPPGGAAPENTLRPLDIVGLAALSCPVFVLAILSPITRWDDLMYHGSRAGYWMQNASALPFISHDDRLSVFPIGGDLIFACGTIISGSELPGKFLVSLAYPLVLFAVLALLKNAGLRSSVALGVIVVFATTPIVLANGVGIKPDFWLVLLGIITLHWILTARRGDAAMSLTALCCLAAASAGAALGVKWTAAPLLLLAPFALLLPGWTQRPAQRWLPPAAAFALALALGGAGPILLFNLQTSHHPFGPKALRAWHQPDPGLHPMLVQLKRLPFLLFAPPYVPSAPVRALLDGWETSAATAIGATEALWRENGPAWPGRFVPRAKPWDEGFSLGWMLVFLGFPTGIYLFRQPAESRERLAFLLISGLSLVFILAVATQTRWQPTAGLPDRFLLPAFAFGCIALAWPVDRLVAGSKPAIVLLGALAGLHALPFLAWAVGAFRFGAANNWQAPSTVVSGSELITISRRLPPGRTILLLADQSCRDYPLFLAREGFANRVLPWGKAAYDRAAFNRSVQQAGVDTVIVVSPDWIDLLWEPPLDARPFVRDMDSRAGFVRLPETGGLVVYLRKF